MYCIYLRVYYFYSKSVVILMTPTNRIYRTLLSVLDKTNISNTYCTPNLGFPSFNSTLLPFRWLSVKKIARR